MSLEDLALSEVMVSRLRTWLDAWNAAFGNGGFASEEDAEDFAEKSRLLVEALQDQLGPNRHVEGYYPHPAPIR